MTRLTNRQSRVLLLNALKTFGQHLSTCSSLKAEIVTINEDGTLLIKKGECTCGLENLKRQLYG